VDSRLDPYLELGVARTASSPEITDAYHHLARQHHPDSRPVADHAAECDAALIRVMDAYAILADPRRRRDYDEKHPEKRSRLAHQAMPPTWIGPGPAWLDSMSRVGSSAPESLTVTPVRWH
jgi:DnaJ-class molecular chaperone